MWHHFPSTDRLSSNRSETRSPYAKNYRTNLTHDQREHLSHRQNISRLPRREFEDRYIALLDEYYALKKENADNNQKIKKMATKLLRLSAEGKSRGVPFPQQLALNENLEIQIYRLEAYNSLLKDRLNAIIKKYSNCIQSTATSSMRRPASCSNLSVKRKIILSEDDLHLFEIPEPPTIINKNDNRSSIGSGSAITTDPKTGTKATSNKSQSLIQYQQSQSSITYENNNVPNAQDQLPSRSSEEKSCTNDLKNIIHKLERELSEAKGTNESLQHTNITLEGKLTEKLVDKHTAENIELVELRRTMVECEIELHELRDQYLTLKSKAENDLHEEHKKIDELTQIVQKEMDRNTSLSKDLQALRNATETIESVRNEMAKEKNLQSDKNNHVHDNLEETYKSNDLPDLLNEAKITILKLQEESKSLKSEIDIVRQQNQEYCKQIESFQNQLKTTLPNNAISTNPPPIPLEPIVIVKESMTKNDTKEENQTDNSNNQQDAENVNVNFAINVSQKSLASDPSSASSLLSDNIYLIKNNQQVLRPNTQKLHYSTTDSEMSSLDSEENFRMFHHKNKQIQSSMMLFESQQPTSMSFSQRMSLLEKVAYYRPLANISVIANEKSHRFLACECNGFECNQQKMFYEEIRTAVKNAKAIMLQEIQNNSQLKIDQDDSEINKYFDDSSECREFLRVQYNLNNLYKKELEIICKTCKKQKQELLKQIGSLKSKLQIYESKQIPNNNNEQAEIDRSVGIDRMLYVGLDEGSFEFHINAFRPTKEGRPLLSCRHGELGSLYVSWTFFECKSESKTSVSAPPNYAYDSSHIYVVPINKHFLACLQNEKLLINVLASTGSTNSLMGTVHVSLSEVLIFPQNKIQMTTKVMSISRECNHNDSLCTCEVSMTKPKHLGNLTLWFRLTCELDVLKSLYSSNLDQWRPQTQPGQISTTMHTNTEVKKAVIASPLNAKDYAKFERTLVSLTILTLTFNDSFELPKDAQEQIYAECNFIGSHRLKTDLKPFSTNEIVFNFKQQFPHNERNLQRLIHILKDLEHSIKFTLIKMKLISDTNSGNDSKGESCEIGFGLLHLGRFVSEWNSTQNNDEHTFKIPILSKQPPYQNIGSLEVHMECILALKMLQGN